MVQTADQAQRERELTKQALASDIERFEARIRAELDWKARLRRDGPKYAIAGGLVVAAAVGAMVLRRARRPDRPEPAPSPTTLQEMATELAAIRMQLDHAKIDADTGPVWQKIALRAVSAAAAAGGTYAARRFMARSGAVPAETAEVR